MTKRWTWVLLAAALAAVMGLSGCRGAESTQHGQSGPGGHVTATTPGHGGSQQQP